MGRIIFRGVKGLGFFGQHIIIMNEWNKFGLIVQN